MNEDEIKTLADSVRKQGRGSTVTDLVYDPVTGEFRQVSSDVVPAQGDVVTEMTREGFAGHMARGHMGKKSGLCCIVLGTLAFAVALVAHLKSSSELERARKSHAGVAETSPALKGGEPRTARPDTTKTRDEEEARIRAARERVARNYEEAVKQEHVAFTREVAVRLSVFDRVEGNIPYVLGKYDFGKCWKICRAIAQNKVSEKLPKYVGHVDVEAIVNADLRDGFFQPLVDARAGIISLLDGYVSRLEACRRTHAAEMAVIDASWDASLGEIPNSLKNSSWQIDETMQALIAAQVGTGVGVALETASLPATCRILSRLLGRAAGKLATSVTVGVVAGGSDGPQPGPMDLVGLGCIGIGAAMTAADVRKAMKVIPAEMGQLMHQTVNEQREEVRFRVLTEGEKIARMYANQARMAQAGS